MHFLQKRVPYLFDVPNKSNVNVGFASSVALVIFSIIWLGFGSSQDRGWYYALAVVAVSLHIYIIVKNGKNILFLFRYGLIAVIALGASIAWSFEEVIFIAPFGAHYQTPEATLALIGSTLLAMAGTSIGWFKGFSRKPAPMDNRIINFPQRYLLEIRLLSIVIIYLAVLVFIYRAGGLITSGKSYTSGGNDLGFEFGALNSLIFVFSSFFLVTSLLLDKKLKSIAYILLPAYTLPILAGSRADYIMQLAIFVFVFYLSYQKKHTKKRNYSVMILLLGAAALYILSQFIGVWRHIGDLGLSIRVFTESFSLFSERSSGLVLSMSTANQMTGHFYTVYAKTNYLGENFLLGSSYFDFLLRTPPGFLGLPRPMDLAWEMNIDGEIMAQGGIYEVAEAYWNFWYVGAFIVPFIITRGLAWLLLNGLSYRKYWFYFISLFVAISLMSPRGIWYQTFAYWRILTVFIVMVFIIRILRGVMPQSFLGLSSVRADNGR